VPFPVAVNVDVDSQPSVALLAALFTGGYVVILVRNRRILDGVVVDENAAAAGGEGARIVAGKNVFSGQFSAKKMQLQRCIAIFFSQFLTWEKLGRETGVIRE